MRVLILSNRVPFPRKGGYSIVIYNTMRELLRQGCQITLFSLNPTKHFVYTNSIDDEVFRQINFYTYSVDDRVNAKAAFFNLFTNKSYNVSRYFETYCANKLAQLLKNESFDVVLFEGLQVASYIDVVQSNTAAKLFFRSHNIESKVWKRLALKESFLPRRIYLNLLSKRLHLFETGVINRFDVLLAISSADEHFFRSMGCTQKVLTIPVALDLTEYVTTTALTPHKSVGYIGSMDWRPNIEGLRWFLDQVWPQLQELRSGIKFHLAGKKMPVEFQLNNQPGYILEGEVENALEFIAKQHVFVVPLFAGGGMRVKIIEAMALGKCVIATSIAAEGINYLHDKNILIADKTDDFYKQILRCFTDKTLIKRIGAEARLLVTQQHDIEKECRKMLTIFENTCNNKA
ncbi:glycosyltransferase family 4 protein [Pseudopedobacter beijingensis]|uniref:Glycosyltransferase family 4 protein n=1 Tax=Pseudopedobacter beijingensis TaxID=1207056 RepID=A0ABW4I7M1_9SPHI